MAFGRIVMAGQLAQAQNWSIGINLAVTDTSFPTPTQMTTFAEAVRSAFDSNFWSGTASWKALASVTSTFSVVHAYHSSAGNPPPPFEVAGDSTGAAVAGTGARSLPPQSAIVVTLLTDNSGRSARGRSYLPFGVGTFTSGTGTLSNSFTASATGFAAFITAVNALSLGSNTVQCVVSGHQGGVLTPLPIRRVRIDNVVDTQRRRRDKIVPTTFALGTV